MGLLTTAHEASLGIPGSQVEAVLRHLTAYGKAAHLMNIAVHAMARWRGSLHSACKDTLGYVEY